MNNNIEFQREKLRNIIKSYVSIYLAVIIAALIIALFFLTSSQEYEAEIFIIIVTSFIFLIIAIRKLFHALCMFLLINPLLFSIDVGNQFPISLQGFLSILIIILGMSYFLLKKERSKLIKLPAVKPFLLFLLFSSFSIIYSPDTPSVFAKFGRIASYLSIYVLLLINLDSEERIQSLIKVVYLSYLLPFLIAILQFFGVIYPDTNYFELVNIGVMSKNSFGIIVSMLTLYLVGQKLLTKEPAIKLIQRNIVYLSPLIILLIWSTTRTAWVGFVGGILLVFFFYGRAKNKFVLSLCLMSLILIFWLPINERLSDLLSTSRVQGINTFDNSIEGSFEGRLFIYWPEGLKLWLEEPIVGHGLGSTNYLKYDVTNIVEKSPHNEYIQVLQEMGIFGFVLYIYLLWSFLSPVVKKLNIIPKKDSYESYRNNLIGAVLVFSGFFIMSMGQETFHNGSIGTLFVVFMSVAHAYYLLLTGNYLSAGQLS